MGSLELMWSNGTLQRGSLYHNAQINLCSPTKKQTVVKELSQICFMLLKWITPVTQDPLEEHCLGVLAWDACSTWQLQPHFSSLHPCAIYDVTRQLTELIWMLICCSVMFSLHSVPFCTFCLVALLISLSQLISPNPCHGLSIPFIYDLNWLCAGPTHFINSSFLCTECDSYTVLL